MDHVVVLRETRIGQVIVVDEDTVVVQGDGLTRQTDASFHVVLASVDGAINDLTIGTPV